MEGEAMINRQCIRCRQVYQPGDMNKLMHGALGPECADWNDCQHRIGGLINAGVLSPPPGPYGKWVLRDRLMTKAVFKLSFRDRMKIVFELLFGWGDVHVDAATETENLVGATPKQSEWNFDVVPWWWRWMRPQGVAHDPKKKRPTSKPRD